MKASLVVVTAALVLPVFAVTGGADHPQWPHEASFAFDHRGGNEWWVEVRLVGYGTEHVREVYARDDDSDWRPLALKSWGNWAASFHVAPGNAVRYKAILDNGAVAWSCQFTHPDGVERCGPDEQRGDAWFQFDHRGGNEWWVEARVESDESTEPSQVSARVAGTTTWTPLKLRSWGNWAGSLHVPPGAQVEFEARLSGGMSWAAIVQSCPFTHPEGDERCTGGSPAGMAAEFTPVGDEDSFGARVVASRSVTGVDARINDGPWTPLDRVSSSTWSASGDLPEGARVEFRAKGSDGVHAFSHAAYLWPSKTPYPGPEDGPSAVAFHHVTGNDWWVQVNVDASRPVVVVMAYVDDPSDAWPRSEPLRLMSWGDWARSIHVPEGSRVKFEVATVGHGHHESEWYAWPPS